ncbi:heavy metal translocating P-type ATPase [Aeropyrum camini]|nr:heavy metal translocating P-type ATPase [Aeropyrum camini]
MLLYSFAESLEAQVEKLALRRLDEARKLIPKRVRVIRNGAIEEVDPSQVKPGDVVLVRKGEAVPVDGVLLDTGVFDLRLITGESEPVTVESGRAIESGAINVGQPVKVKALKTSSESTIQRIVSNALELLREKGATQRLIDRLAPYMIVIVIGAFTAAYVILGPEKSVVLLLAGCPSAFIIASSAATSYSIATLATRGIVARGGRSLESAGKIRAVVLDKTGTITMGTLKPSRVVVLRGVASRDGLLNLVAAAASTSLHPLSIAIARHWKPMGSVERVEEVPGKGLRAVVSGRTLLLGSEKFLEEEVGLRPGNPCGDEVPVFAHIDGTTMAICMSEEVSEKTKAAIGEMKRMGLKLVLASGDRRNKVEKIARELGIEEYYAELKPEDKLEVIRRVREKYGPVSMIGDGVNDLEALAASDLGVAVGNIDAVRSLADAVLVNGVADAPRLYRMGRAYLRGLKSGLFAAAAVKLAVIALGVGGSIPLWLVALLGDDGSTLIGTAAAIMAITLNYRR